LRDDGDGSSSSTNDEPILTVRETFDTKKPQQADYDLRSTTSMDNETLQYVRSLENKIRELEDTRGSLSAEAIAASKPEAIIRALQVLEVRDQIERVKSSHENQAVREMFNKVQQLYNKDA
jgi:hypothetical protein